MFSQNIYVFVKIFIFVTTPLKFQNIVIFFKIRNDIGSNLLNTSMNGFRRKIFDLWKKWCNYTFG